ncbi:Xaa-Pro peptidase family protein [Acuticoccus sp. I52.16.1]|nr:Xaa-Pro peptidase family protein [Acuticoccus sp. I52.16.1]UOM36270.1 Xaa-Pro peptidase family protein [Acuticoccus sp. I52.16.1]
MQALFVPLSGWPTILTCTADARMSRGYPGIGEVVVISECQLAVTVLAGLLPAGRRVGLETTSHYLSVHDHRQLVQMAGVQFEDFDGVIEGRRRVKGPVELERMRRAAATAEAGMTEALSAIRPGATENDIAAAFYAGSIAAGSDYVGHPPVVVAGRRSAQSFARWRRKAIGHGDVVMVEGAGCVDRHHAVMARSAIVGTPTEEHKACAEALVTLLEAATEVIRPGRTAGDIDRHCRATMERYGLDNHVSSRTGYSIGLGFPSGPEGCSRAVRPEDGTVLRENMTFHLVPTLAREDFVMAISDTVRVDAGGCEMLTRFPRELVVVD